MTTAHELAARAPEDARHLSQDAHRQLIGVLGLLLPVLVWLCAGLFPDDPAARWELLHAISAYWYTSAVGVFVGALFALSLFLYTYRGYEGARADRVLGGIAGTAALGVALSPQRAPKGFPEPSWWLDVMNAVHLGSAAVLFLMFAVFSIWLFRLSDQGKRAERDAAKRRRDDVCLICGLVILAAIVWVVLTPGGESIFWQETLALEAFAVSWLVKGKARALKPFGMLD